MPFRDPTRVLILPPGASPPVVGQSVLVLDPGPPPVIKLYTGDADELTPANIRAVTSLGIPQLEINGPDTNSSVFGNASINEGISAGGANTESFVEIIGEDIFIRNASEALYYLRGHSANGGDIVPPPVSYVDIARFKTTSTSMQAQEDSTTTDNNALVNTAYAVPPTASVGFSFRAPPSGNGMLWWRVRIQINTTAVVHRIQLNAPRLGLGSTVGAGAAQSIHGVVTPSDELAYECDNCFANGTVEWQGVSQCLVTGLVFNDLYNVQLQTRITSAVTATYDVLGQSIGWLPLY